jgi:hypothetical protein
MPGNGPVLGKEVVSGNMQQGGMMLAREKIPLSFAGGFIVFSNAYGHLCTRGGGPDVEECAGLPVRK